MRAGRPFLLLGAAYGLLGVVLGAYGAHALSKQISAEMLAVYHTGVEYQFYHAFALLAVGLLGRLKPAPLLTVAGGCFAAGVLLFSGSLYWYALSGPHWLVYVTPLGGLLFMAGWAALIAAQLRDR
jgi:uncharacterized membrane protein YgdD (TMEM256/DUF423 family)